MTERRSPELSLFWSPAVIAGEAKLRDIHVLGLVRRHASYNDAHDLEELLRPLRSGNLMESLRQLDEWEQLAASWADLADFEDADADRRGFPFETAALELTRWVQGEARQHVAEGRFQHALTLIERYAMPPVPLDRDAATLSEKARSNSL